MAKPKDTSANDPAELKYTDHHEWVRPKGKTIVVGVTEYLQERLADVTAVELPEPDDHHFEPDEEVCVVESIRTSIELRAPVGGTIVAVNRELLSRPELINVDPFGEGWIYEMLPDKMSDVTDLLGVDEYEEAIPEEEEE